MSLRVAAIDFLNPAPLMWDFHHPPLAADLSTRYQLHLTAPSQCARDLNEGRADLGLIPIAALTPALRIVPGCTIASLHSVRSIQLIVKAPYGLPAPPCPTLPYPALPRLIAADAASRSSAAYTQVLFRHFLNASPTFVKAPPTPKPCWPRLTPPCSSATPPC